MLEWLVYMYTWFVEYFLIFCNIFPSDKKKFNKFAMKRLQQPKMLNNTKQMHVLKHNNTY